MSSKTLLTSFNTRRRSRILSSYWIPNNSSRKLLR